MALPTQPVTLTAEQVADLNRRLSETRHDINNNLALITAAIELMRMKPAESARMVEMMVEQPMKIKQKIDAFSADFEQAFGIVRPGGSTLFRP